MIANNGSPIHKRPGKWISRHPPHPVTRMRTRSFGGRLGSRVLPCISV